MARSVNGVVVPTIEEALAQTHFGKFNYLLILFSGFVLKSVVFESVAISFALPILECDLSLNYQQQGIIGAVAFIGIIVSSHFWGFLADTTGRKRIMLPALFLGFLVTVLSSFSPNFESLVVLRFINGFLISSGSATIYAYLGEFHCQKYRNRAILSAAMISATCAIFFPIYAWIFINQNWEFYVPLLEFKYKPWRLFMLICGLPGLACGVALCFLPESPKYLLTIGRTNEAVEVLKRIHRVNTKGNKKLHGDEFSVKAIQPDLEAMSKKKTSTSNKNLVYNIFHSMWHQTAPLFMREHLRKTVICSVLQYVLYFSAHGVYMWFPYILNSISQYTKEYTNPRTICEIVNFSNHTTKENDNGCTTQLEISTYQHTIMLEVIYVVLLLIVSYTIGRFGRKIILFLILLICGVCGVLGFVAKIPLLAIYLFVIQLCCGLGVTVVNAIVVDIYPTNLRAMAVCISMMIGRIGSVSGTNAIGILVETHCNTTLISSAAALILAGFLSLLLPHPKMQIKSSIEA
ncbi:synaptic vesicle glycoprotein 2B-like [Teleopsis dalmanni]|uniref:synaptic vesicle glycoprotein 2B-like n=1 Tax=Teleopsis dalmanni TaxID=139649 RepID=UPI0018CF5771|nr:synaptic vesicle glycoprotein 2B-like [Teleopsis dalmanni]XP_037936863.1 synaptic vesicle glycoprotein 2B-like [Teleopsis dalmanni]